MIKKCIWETFPTLFDRSLIDECFSFVLIILDMYMFIAYSRAMGFFWVANFSSFNLILFLIGEIFFFNENSPLL
jgi:hypothetical protein